MTIEVGRGGIGVKYSACMRSHGVPNFPDPNGQGLVTINASMGIDPNSPMFGKAEASCQKLLPVGVAPSRAQQQQFRRQALAFAACIRSHGVPNYPDPTISGTKMTERISASSGLDPNSPIFQAAEKACKSTAPGGSGPTPVPGG